MYKMNQPVKILEAALPHLALQHIQEAFPDMYSFNFSEINSQ